MHRNILKLRALSRHIGFSNLINNRKMHAGINLREKFRLPRALEKNQFQQRGASAHAH